MKKRLSLSVLLFFFACLLSSCATRQASKKTTPQKKFGTPTFSSVVVPDEINAENVASEEQVVFSMHPKHPERLVLRDKIVKYHLNVFEALPDDAIEEKLSQFKFVLALQAPSDYKNATVSVDASAMAQWVVATYEPQGKEALVLAGLIYLSLANPDNPQYTQRYMALLDWSEDVRKTIKDPIERYSSISDLYLSAAKMVPHIVLLDRLAKSLAARQKAVVQFLQVFAGNSGGFSPFMFHSVISRGGIGKEFVHAFFLGDYLNEVLDKMESLGVTDGIEEELLTILSQLQLDRNVAHNYHQLAQLLGPGDPVAGVRACMKSYHLDSDEPRYAMCVGRFFSNMDRHLAAIDYYAKAVARDSGDALVQAMELVQEALYRIHTSKPGSDMEEAISRTEKIVQQVVAKNVNDESVSLAASALIETAAIIEFDDGNIGAAQKYFELAHDLWPSRPTPVTKLAEIFYWRGDFQKAIAYLTDAMNAKDKVGGAFSDYWKAMLYEQRGDCLMASGNSVDALADYQLALRRWDVADFPTEQAPVIAIRRGVLLFHLNDMENSIDKFRSAIRLAPDRRSSYAEIISFLVVNGRLNDAKEFYRLAFNQDMLEGMWKIYFSIWVDGLSRMHEGQSFDLAYGYLQNTASETWQEKLASFFTGTIDGAALRKNAQNKGQLVEADYYEALLEISKGNNTSAKALLQKVIDSNLFAFFEYRMAQVLLSNI